MTNFLITCIVLVWIAMFTQEIIEIFRDRKLNKSIVRQEKELKNINENNYKYESRKRIRNW